jgi:1,2-phenylacetyl-CoA epoxidase catalytic subunit
MSKAEDEALYFFLIRLAHNKESLSRRYQEWNNDSTLHDMTISIPEMVQAEANHAQLLFMLAADYKNGKSSDERYGLMPPLETPWPSWIDLLAANILCDRSLTMTAAAALESTCVPLAEAARIIVQDEQHHMRYGDNWMRRVIGEGGPLLQSFELALLRVWDAVFCWFGPQDDPGSEILYQAGILSAMPNILRARLLSQIGPLTAETRLHLPVQPAANTNAWELTSPLPWDRWDSVNWRLQPLIDGG